MQRYFSLIAKILRRLSSSVSVFVNNLYTWMKFYSNNILFIDFKTYGVPFVMVARGGYCKFGSNFTLNNGLVGNPIGRPQPCVFFVDKGASLIIGNNVGISSTAIISQEKIIIGDNVKIGGGVCIYDTDFHSLDAVLRNDSKLDKSNKKTKPVYIKDNAFVGAHSTILKGVCIGENSIIGACSVVTKSIPDNEIWAGNPATLIRKIDGKKV